MNPKSVNLLDLMTPEEREKVSAKEKVRSNKITAEWMSLSELGVFYGWQAVKDVMDDVITLAQARLLIIGARKVHSSHVYDQALATLAGNSTKKGGFEKIMKFYTKDMKDIQ